MTDKAKAQQAKYTARLIWSIAVIITVIIVLIPKAINFFQSLNDIWDTHSLSGSIDTWNIINTWNIENIPTDVRWYLDYMIKYWTSDVDYFSRVPEWQPNLNSSIWSDNNIIMHDYLNKNRIKFNIPNTAKKWYIMFVTSSKVPNDKNIFIWVDWKTIWRLDKNNIPLETYNSNEYLYELDNLLLIGNWWYKFTKNLWNNPTLSINAVVWQSNNKVEKIIIFFK